MIAIRACRSIVTDHEGASAAAAQPAVRRRPLPTTIRRVRALHRRARRGRIAPVVDSRRRHGALRRHAARARACASSPCCRRSLLAFLLLAGLYIVAHARATRIASECGRAWRASRRTSSARRSRASAAGSSCCEERAADDASTQSAIAHMRGDLERLDRVAHRFERIGRDAAPRRRSTSARSSSASATTFSARVPTLAHASRSSRRARRRAAHDRRRRGAARVGARGARRRTRSTRSPAAAAASTSSPSARAGWRVRIRVADDGPGIPRELRARIFEPGFSTKKSGWGIGLSLAKRIVEENHGGTTACSRPSDARRDVRDYLQLMSTSRCDERR